MIGRVWWCYLHYPNAGCHDLLWLSELYDAVTGVLGLGAIVGLTLMLIWDQRHDKDFKIQCAGLAVMGLIGGLALVYSFQHPFG